MSVVEHLHVLVFWKITLKLLLFIAMSDSQAYLLNSTIGLNTPVVSQPHLSIYVCLGLEK